MEAPTTPMESLIEQVTRWAGERPDHPAVAGGGRTLTYAALLRGAAQGAQRIAAAGVAPGDRVLLAATSAIDFVVAYLATHLARAVAVPITPKLSPEQLDTIVGLIRPALLYGAPGQRLDGLPCPALPLAEVADPAGTDADRDTLLPALDDVADILLTSGTTGVPKGTILTHRNLAAAARNITAFIGNDATDVEVLALPLNHSFGLGRLRCQLSAGGTVVLVPGFMFPNRLFDALAAWRATGFSFVPGAWALLRKLTGTGLSRFADQLRWIEIGSSPMPLEDKRLLAELFPRTRICMHYGLTEASRSAFIEFHESADRLDTIGRASPNVRLAAADDTGRLLAAGETGTLVVQGEHVSPGTWTPAGFVARDGTWVDTGDTGQLDAEGYVHLLGRTGDIINVGGHKVAPVEVEEVLVDHPAILEAACVGVPDPQGLVGSRVKAFLVPVGPDARPPSPHELEHFVRARLESHKIPVAWEWIDAIPKNELGKPRRHLLRQ